MLTVRYMRKTPTAFELWKEENRIWGPCVVGLAVMLLILRQLTVPSGGEPNAWYTVSLPPDGAPVYLKSFSKEACLAASVDPQVVCMSGFSLMAVQNEEELASN